MLPIIFTGCWDSLEINERIFVTTIGVDLNKDPNLQGRFEITYSYPDIGSLGESPTQKDVNTTITTTSETPFDSSRQITTRVSNPFFFKHLKVIVIGEDLFKKPELIKELFDGLNREYKINRKVSIIVAEGSAKDVVNTKVKELAIAGGHLNSMLNNNTVAQRYTKQTFSQIIKDHHISNASFAPRAVPKTNEFKLSGAAVLKNFKIVGWICERENRALALVRDHLKSEVFNVKYNNTTVDYVISQHKSKKSIDYDEDKLKVNINIFLEGYIEQYKLGEKLDTFNSKFIRDMETNIEKVVKDEVGSLVQKLQREYNTDILGIGEYLYKFEPNIWDEVKEDWDSIFPSLDINVKVVVRIRRTGLTK